MIIFDILGAVSLIVGVIFSALGVVGVLRFPDAYTRLQVSGKTSTLGVLFLCLGVGFLMPAAVRKLLALSIFLIFSSPVGSHAVAAAVHRGTRVRNQQHIEAGDGITETSGVHSQEDIERMMQQPAE